MGALLGFLMSESEWLALWEALTTDLIKNVIEATGEAVGKAALKTLKDSSGVSSENAQEYSSSSPSDASGNRLNARAGRALNIEDYSSQKLPSLGSKGDSGAANQIVMDKPLSLVDSTQQKKHLDQTVKDQKHASQQNIKTAHDESIKKRSFDKEWLKDFTTNNQLAEKTGANVANGLAGTFQSFVEKAKAGTLTLDGAFKALGSAIGQAMLGALGDTLIQMGVADLTQGTTLTLKGKYSDSGGYLAAGAAESATGGAIKGLAAAYMADGGLVTRPTLAMVGEAGSPEGIIPLSQLGGMGGTNLSVGTLSMNFPGVSSQSDLSGSNFQRTAARQFIQIQQYANRRTGKRNS